MSNLLPPSAQARMKAEFRGRFLIVISLALFLCAAFFILALIPAAASISSPENSAQTQSAQSGDVKEDTTAITHTKALLTALQSVGATTSLDAVLAALSQRGEGVQIDDISYSVTQQSLSLAGHADSPVDVNTFQQALQSDLRFSNVSVPVSALLGSQNGSFTITMKINP